MQRDTRGGIAYNHSPVVVTPLTSTMTMFFRLRSAVSSFIARGFDVAPPISFVLRLDVTRCSSFAVPLFFQCYEGQRVPARVYSRPAIYPSSLSLSLFPFLLLLPICRITILAAYCTLGISLKDAIPSLDTPTRPVSRITKVENFSRLASKNIPIEKKIAENERKGEGRDYWRTSVVALERR